MLTPDQSAGLRAEIEKFTQPGHDRDCAAAMLSQARLRGDISETQVLHLLRIGWTAGATAEHYAIFDGVSDKNRQVMEWVHIAAPDWDHDALVYGISYIFGPFIARRRRWRLALTLLGSLFRRLPGESP